MSVTLLEVWRAARARSVALAGESAGYLVLAACEAITLLPRRVRLESLELQADGALRVATRENAEGEQAELDLRETLAQLLSVASATGPALSRVASRAPHGPTRGLGAELEKALIPVNRAAARRALVRLYRETSRAIQTGRLAPSLPVPVSVPPVESSRVPPVQVAPMAEDSRAASPEPSPMPPSPDGWELEALTSPETVVARVRAGYRSMHEGGGFESAPPASAKTPRLGSLEVEATLSSAALLGELSRPEELTEPMLEVCDRFDTDIAELSDPESFREPRWGLDIGIETETFDPKENLPASAIQEPEPLELVRELDPVPFLETPTPLLVAPLEAVPVVEAVPVMEAVPVVEMVPYEGLPAEQSDVRALLDGFQVARPTNEVNLRRELSALAGVDLTPGATSQVRAR